MANTNVQPIILVADDTPSDRRMTLDVLAQVAPHARLTVVPDGRQTLDHLLAIARDPSQPLPALVLLDMRMPDLSGVQVLRRLREEPRMATLPVVLFSSAAEPWEILEASRTGCRSYVPKPVEYEDYFEALQSIVRYWLGFNSFPDVPLAEARGAEAVG